MEAVHADPSTASAMPGALLVLPFMIGGFLHLYLWARRYLLKEWIEADPALQQVAQEVQEVKEDISRLKARVWPVGPAALQRITDSLKAEGVAHDIVEDILKRYREATEWDSEPFDQFARSMAGPFVLSAEGKKSQDRFEVKLTVKRNDGGSSNYVVVFLLHNTYDDPMILKTSTEAGNGFSVWMDEDFIVGALVIEKGKDGAVRMRFVLCDPLMRPLRLLQNL